MPSRERLGRHPDCEAAALLECPVVLWPVADLVARPGDLVAARLIGLVGHRASGKRGSGPIRSTLAQPKPKARNFAPTPSRSGSSATSGSEAHMPPAGSTRGKRQKLCDTPDRETPGGGCPESRRAQYGSGVGVDLVDLAVAILSDPEGAFRPREPRGAAGGRRDRGEHVPGLRIDFLDAILGDLKQVATVEGRPRVRGDVNGAQLCSTCRIQGSQRVPGRKPDLLAVVGNAVHGLDPRKGTILTSDFGDRYFREVNLGAR